MIKRIQLSLLVFLFAAVACRANAVSFRTESVEWWVNISDGIVLARAVRIEWRPPLAKDVPVQRVYFEPIEVLHGSVPAKLDLKNPFNRGIQKGSGSRSSSFGEMLIGDQVLLFYGQRVERQEGPVCFHANITRPDEIHVFAAYDNYCHRLTKGSDILELVRKRIRLGYTKKQRGLMVNFTDRPTFDCRWDFVITDDPEFKQRIINDLKTYNKEDAICNLVSYPGEDTVKLLLPLLNDPTTAEAFEVDSNNKRKNVRKWYPIRQAAYLALTLLGEKVEEPTPSYPDLQGWLFSTGMEVSWWYPSGKWRRLRGL